MINELIKKYEDKIINNDDEIEPVDLYLEFIQDLNNLKEKAKYITFSDTGSPYVLEYRMINIALEELIGTNKEGDD
jgi:hypothetical protein